MRVLSEAGLELVGHTVHLPGKDLNFFFFNWKEEGVCVEKNLSLIRPWKRREKMALLSAKGIKGIGLRCSKKK